jgi:glycine cleavage system aminomethyltransferase T
VTSACYSPRLEKNIGFAFVPIEYAELGTELQVESPVSGRVDAVVVQKPFVDPKKEVPAQEVAAGTAAKSTSPS